MINRLLCFGMAARVAADACKFLIAKASLAMDDRRGHDAVDREAVFSSVGCLVVLAAREAMLGILLLYLKQVAIALMVVFG